MSCLDTVPSSNMMQSLNAAGQNFKCSTESKNIKFDSRSHQSICFYLSPIRSHSFLFGLFSLYFDRLDKRARRRKHTNTANSLSPTQTKASELVSGQRCNLLSLLRSTGSTGRFSARIEFWFFQSHETEDTWLLNSSLTWLTKCKPSISSTPILSNDTQITAHRVLTHTESSVLIVW